MTSDNIVNEHNYDEEKDIYIHTNTKNETNGNSHEVYSGKSDNGTEHQVSNENHLVTGSQYEEGFVDADGNTQDWKYTFTGQSNEQVTQDVYHEKSEGHNLVLHYNSVVQDVKPESTSLDTDYWL